jgi:hypothetical protein
MCGTFFCDGTVFVVEARIYQFYVQNKLVVPVEQIGMEHINCTYGSACGKISCTWRNWCKTI